MVFSDRFQADPPTSLIQPFTEVAIERGLVYAMQDYPQQYGAYGFGLALADLNGNGHPDAVLVGAAGGQVGIFENFGDGTFADRSQNSGIPLLPQGSGVAAADYNGNGRVDLYFTQFGEPDVLVRNDGDFKFTDVTDQAGLGSAGWGQGASWGDFNGNGWLDLYVTNYTSGAINGGDRPNKLYVNNGNGTFDSVGEQMGLDDGGLGFVALWFDHNRNGWLDLYLSNDRAPMAAYPPNRLWRNDEGELVEISESSGAGISIYSMGFGVGDFNRNGHTDVYITNLPDEGNENADFAYNPLLLNQGDETFIEAARDWGVDNPIMSWGALMFDVTNNGLLDLYVNNMFQSNTLFINTGQLPLIEQGEHAGVSGRNHDDPDESTVSYSAAFADVTGNGALDLLVNDLGGNVLLYINNASESCHYIRFRMVGEYPNLHAIGGNVDVLINDTWHFEEIYGSGHGYLGQNELTLHVGAGRAEVAEEIVVRWPSQGPTRTLYNYPVNQVWDLYPPDRLGDVNGDGHVGFADFEVLADCFDRAVKPGCEIMDLTGDGQINLDDATAFFERYEDELTDCNDSGQPDLLDILLDPELDGSGDWQIDTCTDQSAPDHTIGNDRKG